MPRNIRTENHYHLDLMIEDNELVINDPFNQIGSRNYYLLDTNGVTDDLNTDGLAMGIKEALGIPGHVCFNDVLASIY